MLTRRAALAVIYGAARVSCLAQGNSPFVKLPARLNRNHQIVIPVSVNGGPQLWCLINTGGAKLLYLGRQKANELGVVATSNGHSSGPSDSGFRVDARARATLDAGGVQLTDPEVMIKEWRS